MKLIERFFTKPNENVWETVTWNKRDAVLTDKDGKEVFRLNDVEAPEFWSDNAVNIVASKYFKVVAGKQETSVRELIERVVDTIVKWGTNGIHKLTHDDDDICILYDELVYIILHQYATFNSPVWFNLGVPGRPQQFSACFLLDVQDDMKSILNWIYDEGLIFKGGSGSGVNLSLLRGKGEKLSAGGNASGPVSFFKAADAAAGVIKSGGTTRRAACMRVLNADHPDIKEFIWCKVKEDKKAKALIKAGYSADLDGEAYSTVAFQNANISVRVSNQFMSEVVKGKGPEYKLLHEIAEATWHCGDPGLQFDTVINIWHTTPTHPNITSNPCSEYLGVNNTSCNLASINAYKVKDDYRCLQHIVKIFTTAMDIMIDSGEYPTEAIADGTKRFRNIGLGLANIGAMLMSEGIPYDSDRGRNLAAELTSILTAQAYLQSALLAQRSGPFIEFNANKEKMLRVIQYHKTANENIFGRDDLNITHELWQQALEYGRLYGYRNSSVSLYAPTGTIAFMMDCDTTGIEPDIALIKYKKLVGGGYMNLPSRYVEEGLNALGIPFQEQTKILQYIKDHNGEYPPEHTGHKVFQTALGNNALSPLAHLKMVAAVQPFVSHGISKTINMPNSATIEDIYDIYVKAWEMGIKCVAVYRDGSKAVQPIGELKSDKVESRHTPERQRPARTRNAITHKFSIAGCEGYITVGLFPDGRPAELFITSNKFGSTVSGLLDAFGTAVSFSLQYGVPIEFLVNKFKGAAFEPAGFTGYSAIPQARSIVDYVAKWLEAQFVREAVQESSIALEEKVLTLCNKCGSIMATSGTCHTCPTCGESSGGCG